MVKLGFVIPTYNRASNLALCLTALAEQRQKGVQRPPLQVAVWDDGSDTGEDARSVCDDFSGGRLDMRYGWHRHAGYRVSLARNRGARLLDADTTHFWFVDSDVLLNPGAYQHALELADRLMENTVICGKYDWLPPMEISTLDVSRRWEDIGKGELPRKEVDYIADLVGPDIRFRANPFRWDCTLPVLSFGGSTLSGNLIVPARAMRATGGFDEAIEGQGQDCEFGYHLQSIAAEVRFCPHIYGLHVSHPYDRVWKAESVRETIRYIHEKYNLPLPEEKESQ